MRPRVINPCNGVHEFTSAAKASAATSAHKTWNVLLSCALLMIYSDNDMARTSPTPVARALAPGATEGHLRRTWTFIGGQGSTLTGHTWELLHESDLKHPPHLELVYL